MDGSKNVYMGNSSTSTIMGKGTVQFSLSSGKILTLRDTYHIPRMGKNLVSINRLDENVFKVTFESHKAIISNKGLFVGKGYVKDNMYLLSTNKTFASSSYIVEHDSNSLWRFRLGHIDINAMQPMISYDLIPKSINMLSMYNCECCAQSGIVKAPFKSVSRSTFILELIHTDIL